MAEQLQLATHIPASANQFQKTSIELIREIFRFACLSPDATQHSDSVSPQEDDVDMDDVLKPLVVLSISEVCRQWREVLLYTPELWSQVLIEFRNGLTPRGVYGTQRWLRRSQGYDRLRNYPLDVRFLPQEFSQYLTMPSHVWFEKGFVSLITSLLRYQHCWREFEFVQPFDVVKLLLTHPFYDGLELETRFETLEKFILGVIPSKHDLEHHIPWFPDETHGVWNILATRTPNIKHIEFNTSGPIPVNVLDLVSLPRTASHLTVLRFSNVFSAHVQGSTFVRQTLLRYPTLEEALFDKVYDGFEWENMDAVPELRPTDLDVVPNLRVLKLGLEAKGADWVLSNFKLPKLESLGIDIFNGDHLATPTRLFNEILLRLQENSRFPLKRLYLRNIARLSVDHLDQFLRGVNYTLVELHLISIWGFRFATLIHRLYNRYPEMKSLLSQENGFWLPSPTPILPRLSTLSIAGYTPYQADTEIITTYVLWRTCAQGSSSKPELDGITPLSRALIQLNARACSMDLVRRINLVVSDAMARGFVKFEWPSDALADAPSNQNFADPPWWLVIDFVRGDTRLPAFYWPNDQLVYYVLCFVLTAANIVIFGIVVAVGSVHFKIRKRASQYTKNFMNCLYCLYMSFAT
ncbi:hypothetical protein K435DRAFT_792634 [Dendrothele bispora CBS 962.96]|uniref:Uncharacterized protein n=1 Tax=Dendrothele bispora (strain CBS 962.96) TaxID=1314807 RepID=A0A4V4HHD5_DENBC|nr:hypothetical protein K435DRAFT_792634 [Dendrothele bispora CBS 962.96]